MINRYKNKTYYINLVDLNLRNNNLISLNRLIFNGLDKLQNVYLENNPIAIYIGDYLKELCLFNPFCTIYY